MSLTKKSQKSKKRVTEVGFLGKKISPNGEREWSAKKFSKFSKKVTKSA
jgi:hypothetical protein